MSEIYRVRVYVRATLFGEVRVWFAFDHGPDEYRVHAHLTRRRR